MDNIRRVILLELMNGELNFDPIEAVVANLVRPFDIVEPVREIPVRNEDYYENVIPNYSPDDFHNHFRMSRATFQNLLNVLQQRYGEIISKRVLFEKKILFTIWLLSKPESFIAAGDRFNSAKSTSHQIFFNIVNLLTRLRHEFIVWSNEHKRQRIGRLLQAAHPLLPYLLKPYRDNGHLNHRQTRFNTRMSSVRSMIEQTFGLLKCKFRRLKYLEMARIDLAPSVVTTACVVHNYIIFHEGIPRLENEMDFVGVPEANQDYLNNDEGLYCIFATVI